MCHSKNFSIKKDSVKLLFQFMKTTHSNTIFLDIILSIFESFKNAEGSNGQNKSYVEFI